MSTDSAFAPHLTSEELAAYLDDRLDVSAVARVESHLAACRECREELVATRALVEAATTTLNSRSAARTLRVRSWLVAAAIVVIAVLPLANRSLHSRGDASLVRAAPAKAPNIAIIAPADRPTDVASVAFVWRPVDDARTCRLTVTDSAGAPLFTVATTDTIARPPATSHLERGGSYLWYLDCLTTDGQTVTSGIRSLETDR